MPRCACQFFAMFVLGFNAMLVLPVLIMEINFKGIESVCIMDVSILLRKSYMNFGLILFIRRELALDKCADKRHELV